MLDRKNIRKQRLTHKWQQYCKLQLQYVCVARTHTKKKIIKIKETEKKNASPWAIRNGGEQ